MTTLDQLEALLAAIAEPAPKFKRGSDPAFQAWCDRVDKAEADFISRGPALLACARAAAPFAEAMKYIGDEAGDDDTPEWSPFIEIRHYRAVAEALKMLEVNLQKS